MKIKMHTLLNRIAFWALLPICVVASFFIYKDAANDKIRIIGLIFIVGLFLLFGFLFINNLGLFNYAVFKNDGIELHSTFKRTVFYKYSEVIGCFASYTSIIENKKYITFTDKKYNSVVTQVDTSKRGNLPSINKMKVVYVPATENIINFLKDKSDLQWYINK